MTLVVRFARRLMRKPRSLRVFLYRWPFDGIGAACDLKNFIEHPAKRGALPHGLISLFPNSGQQRRVFDQRLAFRQQRVDLIAEPGDALMSDEDAFRADLPYSFPDRLRVHRRTSIWKRGRPDPPRQLPRRRVRVLLSPPQIKTFEASLRFAVHGQMGIRVKAEAVEMILARHNMTKTALACGTPSDAPGGSPRGPQEPGLPHPAANARRAFGGQWDTLFEARRFLPACLRPRTPAGPPCAVGASSGGAVPKPRPCFPPVGRVRARGTGWKSSVSRGRRPGSSPGHGPYFPSVRSRAARLACPFRNDRCAGRAGHMGRE